jgi:hypothetical protein
MIPERILEDLELGYSSHATDRVTRLVYLANEFFGFTTYCSVVAEFLTTKALEVCEAIANRTTFEYNKDPENEKWFTVMCNMDFFKDKIEWGTSIRGAWWDDPILHNGEAYTLKEWETCMLALVEFSKRQGPPIFK